SFGFVLALPAALAKTGMRTYYHTPLCGVARGSRAWERPVGVPRGSGCALGGPEPIASMTSRAHRPWDSPQTYWLVLPLFLPFRSTPRRVDDRLIPMLGCGPYRLSDSRTACSHTAPVRADPQHRKLTAHAHGQIVAEVACYRECMRLHSVRCLPEPFGDRLRV